MCHPVSGPRQRLSLTDAPNPAAWRQRAWSASARRGQREGLAGGCPGPGTTYKQHLMATLYQLHPLPAHMLPAYHLSQTPPGPRTWQGTRCTRCPTLGAYGRETINEGTNAHSGPVLRVNRASRARAEWLWGGTAAGERLREALQQVARSVDTCAKSRSWQRRQSGQGYPGAGRELPGNPLQGRACQRVAWPQGGLGTGHRGS